MCECVFQDVCVLSVYACVGVYVCMCVCVCVCAPVIQHTKWS